MKKIISSILSFSILLSIFAGIDLTVLAETSSDTSTDNSTEIIDIDIYKAQCLAGIAYDPNSDAVEQCNNLYSSYINPELYSPTQTFLEAVYEDSKLVADYNKWMAYSLSAEPSSALNLVAARENYYEACIIAMYTKSTIENSGFQRLLKNNILNASNNMVDALCEAQKVDNAIELIEIIDIQDHNTITQIQKLVEDTYSLKTVSNITESLGHIIKYGTDILDVIDKIAIYGSMVNLDIATKQWLVQMYSSCNGNTNPSLKTALYNLKTASTDYAGAVLVEMETTAFTLANWTMSFTLEAGTKALASLNPVTASIVLGLKLGKTICNLFFNTDDICEQIFVMECIYHIQDLSRTVTENSKNIFISQQSKENALTFIYALDCYYESIINVDIDCMKQLLDKLYNGGILKGFIKWCYGATDDYQEAVNGLESIRAARKDNYDLMIAYFKFALQLNFPDTYNFYFLANNVIPITNISFTLSRILPPKYPSNYADMIVGDFCSLDVKYIPSNTTQRAFTVVSDNTDVIEINDNVLTAVSAGVANITITSVENPNVSYTSEISVGKRLLNTTNDGLTTRFTYTLNENNEATITGLVDGYKPKKLAIPSKIENHSVTRIGNDAFRDCTNLINITIPNSITSIGESVFHSCASLTDIIIPDSVTYMGSHTFVHCTSLNNVSIGKGISSIGMSAFFNCTSLTDVVIPNNIASIGKSAFNFCVNLESITMPDSVTTIEDKAFNNCSIKELIVSDGSTSVTDVMTVCHETLEKVTLPNTLTIIDNDAFNGCINLIDITIPSSVTQIENNAFRDCASLENITIPNSVTSIGESVFHSCASLTDIIIPDSVTYMGSHTFVHCTSLNNVSIGKGISSIGMSAFFNCTSLTDVVIPNNITSIGNYAFADCTNLKTIIIPDSLTDIKKYAFVNCNNYTMYCNIGNITSKLSSYGYKYKCFGDFDDDKKLRSTDIALMRKSLLGKFAENYDEKVADINQDNDFNILDLVRLKKKLAGIIA